MISSNDSAGSADAGLNQQKKHAPQKCPAFFNEPGAKKENKTKQKNQATIFPKKLTAAYLKQFMTVKELDKYVMKCCSVIFFFKASMTALRQAREE